MQMSIDSLGGPLGFDVCRAMAKAKTFLDRHDNRQLLDLVGTTVENVALKPTINKAVMQKSYGGGHAPRRTICSRPRPVLYYRAGQTVPRLHGGALPDELGLRPSRADPNGPGWPRRRDRA